jgi:DnaJ-class molecular chaperone
MTDPPPPGPNESPGDEASPGTEGTGENLCPRCGGSGHNEDGSRCEHCLGTGRVIEGIGGG